MTEEALKLSDLPSSIPVFPLPGAILLPGSNLPLNIFEPRYLQMVKDARAGHSLIGMIQPRDPDDASKAPEIFETGCVGRITHYAETQDGRNIIRLTGLCRFHVDEELQTMTPYRQVKANWSPFGADLGDQTPKDPINRNELLAALRMYLDKKGLDADYEGINTAPDQVLINTLSMIIPFGVAEKQALLESDSVTKRAITLTSLLTMMTAATQNQPAGKPS